MLQDNGSVFKMDGDCLLYAPLHTDGSFDEDEWSEVDFYSIDEKEKTYCMAIRVALVAQQRT